MYDSTNTHTVSSGSLRRVDEDFPVKPQTPVREATDRLSNTTDRLHHLIEKLESTLAGVTGAPRQPISEDALSPQSGSSDLVNALAEINARGEAACYRLEQLLNRVEL